MQNAPCSTWQGKSKQRRGVYTRPLRPMVIAAETTRVRLSSEINDKFYGQSV